MSREKVVLLDAALLFEMELNEICDITIGVLAKEGTCIKRICKRDNLDEEKAKARIKSQKISEYFKINCDYCINNEEECNITKEINEILGGENLSNKNMIHMYDKNVEYLQFRRLLQFSQNIKHCYTMKPLDFNIGDKEKVLNDYKKICNALELDNNNIYRPSQTHSSNVKKILYEDAGIYGKELQDIDGLITKEKNKIMSLTFADCICLYFYDPVRNVAGNIHSGWRGTYQEIARNAVKKLKEEYNVKPEDLICRNWAMYKRLLF